MQLKKYDLVIIGGGLVGTSLLLALKDSGLCIALIESKQLEERIEPELDQRSLVLSHGSRLYYEQLGLWATISKYATKINTIKISEQGQFSKLFLDKDSFGVDSLGYVVNIQLLNKALWQSINLNQEQKSSKSSSIDILCPYKLVNITDNQLDLEFFKDNKKQKYKIAANIIIAADGGQSFVRSLLAIETDSYNYNQLALIANVEHETENQNTAYERFSKQGPFALLPRENKNISGIVWPWDINQQDYIKNISDHELLTKLQKLFGYKLGRFKNIGKRQFFPLWRISTKELYKNRVLFLGNSANNINPIGGQGFNLGLRDVKFFSKILLESRAVLINNDFDLDLVNQLYSDYKNSRTDDHFNLVNGTHGILKLFASSNPLVKLSRNLGMTTFNHSLVLRTMLADHSMGLRVE